jgi:hypothetical protein
VVVPIEARPGSADEAEIEQFALDYYSITDAVLFHLDAQCRDKIGRRAHSDKCGPAYARMLVEDTLTGDTEKCLRRGLHAV